MAQTIMTVIEDSLDPRSVTNALYELMVEWRSCVYEASITPSKSRRRTVDRKRKWIENTLGRFFNKDRVQMRELLEGHFQVKVER